MSPKGKYNLSGVSVLIISIFILLSCFSYPRWDTKSTNAVITWDGYGYYLYLPSVFIYHDWDNLEFKNSIQEKYHPTEGFYQAYRNKNTGKYVMKYPIGMSFTWLPFFFIAHQAAGILNYPQDGFSEPYQIAIAIANLIFAFVGLYFLRKGLLYFFSDTITTFLLFIIGLGTNFFNQAAHSSQMTHACSFALFAIIINVTIFKIDFKKPSSKEFFVLGLIIGLCTIIRPTNLLVAIFPLLFGITSGAHFIERIKFLMKNFGVLISACAGFAIMVLPQMIYWKIQAGSFIYFSYESEEGFLFMKPFLLQVLFSFKKGWLLYTPIMAFAIIGLVSLYKKNLQIFWSVFIFFILNLWIISSWKTWWYGGNFGQRPFVESYTLMAIPLGYFLNELKNFRFKILKYLIIMVMSLLVILNQFQIWQYMHGMYSGDKMNKVYYQRIFFKTTADANDIALIEDEVVEKQNIILTEGERKKYEKTAIYSEKFVEGSGVILTSESKFSPGLNETADKLKLANYKFIHAIGTIRKISDLNASLVISLEHGGNSYAYLSVKANSENCSSENRCTIDATIAVPNIKSSGDILKIYIYYSGTSEVNASEIEVELLSNFRKR